MTPTRLRLLLAAFGSLASSAFLMLPGGTGGPSFDAAVFTAVAYIVRSGGQPYVDAWDHKPPLVYVADAVAQAAAPWWGAWGPIWLMSVLVSASVGFAVTVLLHRLGFRLLAIVGALLASGVISLFVISLGGGLTEPLATLPIALALLALVGRAHSLRAAAISGALVGVAMLSSLQAAPGALAIVGLVAFGAPGGWPRAAVFLLTAVAPVVAAGAWLAVSGSLGSAVDAVIRYSAAYRSASLAWHDNYAHAESAVVVLALLWVGIPASLGAMRWLRSGGDRRRFALASLVWVAATVAVPIYIGRFETHYAAPLAIPLGVLAVGGVADFALHARRSKIVLWGGTLAWAAASALSVTVAVLNSNALGASLRVEADRTELVATYIRRHSGPADTIFVWGNEPHLYYLAERLPASRFIYLLPLTTPGYATDELIADVATELGKARPALVIDAGSFEPGSPGDPPLLIDRPIVSDGRDLDILDPLRDLIADRYRLVEVVDGWPVYGLRDGT